MSNEQKSIKLYNPEAKVLLDYDLSRVQAILDVIRNGEDSLATKTLQEYEHLLAETYRLDQDRLQREGQERIKGHEQVMERTSDD